MHRAARPSRSPISSISMDRRKGRRDMLFNVLGLAALGKPVLALGIIASAYGAATSFDESEHHTTTPPAAAAGPRPHLPEAEPPQPAPAGARNREPRHDAFVRRPSERMRVSLQA